MTGPAVPDRGALLVLGCPEVPVQMAIALYVAHNLRKEGIPVLAAGNPSVLNLLKVSDPGRHYIGDTMALEKCIEEVAEKGRRSSLCVVFAHNDAGVSYAATMRHLLPETRLVVILFGREPEDLAAQISFPCDMVVDKVVHNPVQLKRKIDRVFGWAASRT